MTTILFFDTETTGFYQKILPHGDQKQPQLVQLGMILTDEHGEILDQRETIVRPDVPIPQQAIDVHGITDQKAAEFGVDPRLVVQEYQDWHNAADIKVAHNMWFDDNIMRCQEARLGLPRTKKKPTVCTMRKATPIVNLPPTDKMKACGMTQPKSASLAECIQFFFGEELDGAHDAMVDTKGCMRVYFKLKELGHV